MQCHQWPIIVRRGYEFYNLFFFKLTFLNVPLFEYFGVCTFFLGRADHTKRGGGYET